MSSQPPFGDPEGPQPTEEEMRAAYEEQLKALRVEDVVVETIVSLLNLGGRKAGLVPGTEDEADAAQVRIAVEGVRALLPLVEAGPVATGGAPDASDAPAAPGDPEAPGPAQSSGRLWVPGQ